MGSIRANLEILTENVVQLGLYFVQNICFDFCTNRGFFGSANFFTVDWNLLCAYTNQLLIQW